MSQYLIGFFLFVTPFVTISYATTFGEDKPPKFNITTKQDTDIVEVSIEKNRTVFSIHSPIGISQALIERTEVNWTDPVVLRLYLKGLESFRATNGKVRIDAAVSIHKNKQPVRLWKDGKGDSQLKSNDPFWMEIRVVGGDGKPSKDIRLKDGCFEMQLPKAFFGGNPKSISLFWIDFYR